jgi:hypothetical protein
MMVETPRIGWPVIVGSPGENATATTNITVETRSNGNYTLDVDVGNLTHTTHPTANMSRDLVWVRGGDLDDFENFTELTGVIYFYGDAVDYHFAEGNGTSLSTTDVQYKCNIPIGQIAGDYTGTVHYHLSTT